MFTTRFNMLSGSDAIAVLHMHDGMVCRHPINEQSLYCIY